MILDTLNAVIFDLRIMYTAPVIICFISSIVYKPNTPNVLWILGDCDEKQAKSSTYYMRSVAVDGCMS